MELRCFHNMGLQDWAGEKVSIIPKRRDADSLVVDLRSVSSLTGSDYLRFSIICSSALEGPLKLLASCGKARLSDLSDPPRPRSAR
eukprot:s2047_g9.t1